MHSLHADARNVWLQVAARLLRDRADDGSQLFVNFLPSPPGGPVGKYQVRCFCCFQLSVGRLLCVLCWMPCPCGFPCAASLVI